VSSTGIANDPLRKLYAYGGEINTKPCASVSEQVMHIADIIKALEEQGPEPIVNYRSNMHIHIRVPGLKDDLATLKKMYAYFQKYYAYIFSVVEPIPVPIRHADKPHEHYVWECKRYQRRLKSHQYMHSHQSQRQAAILKAETPQEFFEEHAPLTEKGRMWFFAPRCGINFRQLWEPSETLEFRHFPGTLDLREIHCALQWCKRITMAALADMDPYIVIQSFNWEFPKFPPYEFETEQVYQWTNHDKNARKLVAERLAVLRNKCNIDDMATTSLEVYNCLP